MSKYHPLDVRYKGPSTAYRGSAYSKSNPGFRPKRSKPAAANQPQGPWSGVKSGARTAPKRQAERTLTRENRTVFQRIFGAFRTIKNLYIAFILIVLVTLFFGNPT